MLEKTALLEYRVRPVTRYVVTRYTKYPDSACGVDSVGEFDNEWQAQRAAHVFGEFDKRLSGWTVLRPDMPEAINIPPSP